jgi:hypothetical protein
MVHTSEVVVGGCEALDHVDIIPRANGFWD